MVSIRLLKIVSRRVRPERRGDPDRPSPGPNVTGISLQWFTVFVVDASHRDFRTAAPSDVRANA